MTSDEEKQLLQTIEMFEVITQEAPHDYQALEILKEGYIKLGRQKEVVQTSKRIAQAYMQFGQLSLALLEYEGILQKFPDDREVQAAVADIEKRAMTGNAPAVETEITTRETPKQGRGGDHKLVAADVDDGRQVMQKLFVDSKLLAAHDFDLYWPKVDLNESPANPIEPFIQVVHEKNVLPSEKSLKLLVERTKLGYLPIEKYDIDVGLARQFPKEVCRRWCVLPFDRMSKTMLVATANPFNKYAARELETVAKHRLVWFLVPPVDLVKALKKVFR